MQKLDKLNINKKKYIIFDLDGTLIDSIGVWNKTDQELIKKFGKITIDLDNIQKDRDNFLRNNQGSDIYIAYCKYLIDKYNLEIDVDILSNARVTLANNVLANKVNYKDGAVDLIMMLKSLGFTVILATITTRRQLNIYSKKNMKMASVMNIEEVFDLIVTKEDVINKKPDPEIYYKILNYYNANPCECLIFEDSYSGVLAGNNAGIDVVNVYDKHSDNNREKIDLISDYFIDDFSQFIHFLEKNSKKKTF